MAIGKQELSTEEWEERVGEQFRALRLARGRDQAEVADAAGVSVGAVKNLEQGKGSTLKTIIKVARTLDRSEWLLALSPPTSVSPIEILRASGRQQRRRVYRPRGGIK
jgi:transcriptional regulator with XRE-family HTH domain